MENLAWSNGIKAERSSKEDNPALQSKRQVEQIKEHEPPNENIEREIIEENKGAKEMDQVIDKVKGDYTLTRNTFRKTSNRRESSNTKLSERYMISRACGNPFLTHLNYTDDILTQEQFLIPKNSNMENEYDE
jgi:hypothetical protein